MNYFTPDLLARFGSADDGVADAANEEWESAQERYWAHLTKIRTELPKGVRRVLRRFSLHDAQVVAMTVDQSPYLSLFLRVEGPASPASQFLELRYRLATRPKISRHPSDREDGTPLRWWLYDEFELVSVGNIRLFSHSILLSGGWEMQITFYDMKPIRLTNLLMFPQEGALAIRDFESEVRAFACAITEC
jgi:hypothetical protein